MRARQSTGGSWVDWLLDAAFVALAVLAQVEVWVRPEAENQPLLVVLTLVWTLAPLARRKFPFAAPMAALVAVGAMTFVAPEYVPSAATSVIGLALVAGVLGAYNEPRLAAAGLALAWGVVALVAAQDPQENLVGSLVAGLVATACWVVGLGWYRRSAYAAALHERAERAERERETAARVAVAEERARIARELHDVVAHSVSVMVLQAGAVRRMLGDEQAREREALDTVERTGREALTEMRRLLGVLRTPDEQAELAPQPGLSELRTLVARTEAAGLPVDLRVEGEPAAPLPLGVDLSAYRIVQEALTNALKHADAAHAEVAIRYQPDAIDIEVVDDGRGPAASNGSGHGLVGMRERTTLYGGEFSAGAREGGGFVVRARLPIPAGSGMTTRVLIADDQDLVRAGLRMILDAEETIDVVAEATNGREAVEQARLFHPDVVLMDIRMPELDGLAATRLLLESPETTARVLILTTFDLDEYVYEALRAGASGFLLKDSPPEQLIAGIAIVARGDALLAPSVTRRVVEEFARRPRARPGTEAAIAELTPRELDVLRLIARGLSNAEIAASLVVSEATVKTHVAHILMKLELRDRVQAVVLAYESGLVEPGAAE